MEYRKLARANSTSLSIPSTARYTSVKVPSASRAARNLRSGLARLDALERTLSEDSVASSSVDSCSATSLNSESLSPEEREAAELAEDRRAVIGEWDRYINDGIIDDPGELADFDLCQFWNVCLRISRIQALRVDTMISIKSAATLCSTAPLWMYYLSKHLPFPVNAFFRQAKKQTPFVDPSLQQLQWKYYRY
jgi:hypothetical protein